MVSRTRAKLSTRCQQLCLLALLWCVGCAAAHQSFMPAERRTGMTAQGLMAAEYEVAAGDGSSADVKVWSRGTLHQNFRDETETFAHVAFEVDNQTQQLMRLDFKQLHLEGTTFDEATIGPVRPAFLDGDTAIPAGEERIVQAWFPLPKGISPSDVRTFRVAWTLAREAASYSQRTPFFQSRQRYYHSPYYDPFIYDPYMFHGGVMMHPNHYYHFHHYHRHRPFSRHPR